MFFNKKLIRYYYWILIAFLKKNNRFLIISFFASLIVFISLYSLFPYLDLFFNKKKKIGIVGNYTLSDVPEEILNKISNGLINIDEKGNIIPVLANSWEIKENGKIYRFHLKENLFWNDNKRFSAFDIKYNFSDVQVKPIDRRTVDFILKEPLGIFVVYLNKPIIRDSLVGVAGYYRVGRFKISNGYLKEIELIPNLNNFSSIKYFFYQNENQLVNAYKRGEINEMNLYKKSIADSFLNWKNTKVTRITDYSKVLTIFFNFKNPIFNNKNIREALAMVIDDKKISDYGELAKTSIPPTSWAYNPNLKDYNYDPETAKKIINKEKISTVSSSLNFFTFFDYYDIADKIADEMNKVNFPVKIKIASFENIQNFDILLASLKIFNDPDQYYYWHSTQKKSNIGNYKNIKVDLLLEKGRSTIDIQERKRNYFDFQKVISEDIPAIFLYFPYIYKIERK